jgi:hypothetical protein
MVQPERPQMTIMRFARLITKATHIHTQNMQYISVFPQQQQLLQRASMLRYTCNADLAQSHDKYFRRKHMQ